jgi:hypothetical protein
VGCDWDAITGDKSWGPKEGPKEGLRMKSPDSCLILLLSSSSIIGGVSKRRPKFAFRDKVPSITYTEALRRYSITEYRETSRKHVSSTFVKRRFQGRFRERVSSLRGIRPVHQLLQHLAALHLDHVQNVNCREKHNGAVRVNNNGELRKDR